mmetsp:Transcript_15407/g.62009  ORF Transcript_15407/g.62009 Transcript_15407/m.62009 type:complete len:236 (-) Transcript_15407:2817-3524(-)
MRPLHSAPLPGGGAAKAATPPTSSAATHSTESLQTRRLVRSAGLGAGVASIATATGLEAQVLGDVRVVLFPALLGLTYLGARAVPRLAPTPPLELNLDLEVRPSAGAGLGLFALRRIPRGTFVMDYLGESLDEAAFVARYGAAGRADYGLELDGVLPPWLSAPTFVDARVASRSNAARFMNHAPRGTPRFTVDKRKQRWPRRVLRFYASRDIAPGEELCWDYGDAYWKGREADLR